MPNVRGRGTHAVSLARRTRQGHTRHRRIAAHPRPWHSPETARSRTCRFRCRTRGRRMCSTGFPRNVVGVVDVEVGAAAACVGERSLHVRIEAAQRERVARDQVALEVRRDRQGRSLRRLDVSSRRQRRCRSSHPSARCRSTPPRCDSRRLSVAQPVELHFDALDFGLRTIVDLRDAVRPWKETWMSSHSSRKTAPLNCSRSSAKRVFQPSS